MNKNIKKLSKIGFFDIKPGLERIKIVLEYLDNPQDKFKSVLIAGTNGKGSVAAILSNILTKNNLKTGLYTSPHLISVTERLKIDGKDITNNLFDKLLEQIFHACETTGTQLSYFEIVTASAFLYFNEQNVDIAVLEVGMGGRWDATNVVDPLISIITNISLDHTEHLGKTRALIAGEKAEIIKNSAPIVSGVDGDEQEILIKKAESVNSKSYFLGKEFYPSVNNDKTFNYIGIYTNKKILTTNLSGIHQVSNSALALAASEILNKDYCFNIDFEKIDNALNTVNYEGRFEILRTDPYLILDAAHNTGSAEALVRSLKETGENKFVYLISMLSDKDHNSFISLISKTAQKIVITKIPNERSVDPSMLFNVVRKYVDDVDIVEDCNKAFEYIKSLNKPVCITGSVYLVGRIKEIIKNNN